MIKLIDFSSIDTKDFCRAGIYYDKNGCYPQDSDWWDEEFKRMKDGHQVGKWKITGEHYTYLNYCRIKLTSDDDIKKMAKSSKKLAVRKIYSNPNFWDGDYIFYWCKWIARWGMSEEEYLALNLPVKIKVDVDIKTGERTVGGGKNLCVGKKRRFGASYKLGSSGARNYVLYPRSLTLLCAYDTAYLTGDGIMSKVKSNIDFFDDNTQFGGRRLINLEDDVQMGYKEKKDGVEISKGNLSRVMALTYRTNPAIARGKDAEEIYAEESGKSPNLGKFSNATMDTMGDGKAVTGQIIWFGTGGGDNNNWEDFRDIFLNPAQNNALEIENQWSENAAGTYCGLFIPDYWCVVGDETMTPNGESIIDIAKMLEENYQYETFIKNGDIKGLIARKMEHPFTPEDAFNISEFNIFDVESIKTWRNHLETTGLYKDLANIGWLERDETSKLRFKIDNTAQPLWDFPIKKGTSTKGAIVMWYSPTRIDGKVPNDLYIIDVDTYRHTETTGDSVGAVYVKIRSNNVVANNLDNRLVACYIGRPKDHDDFNKIIFLLAEYYNAKIAFENDEPGGIVDYAKRFRLIHMLEPQFELAYDEKLKTKSTMKRQFGMHMGSGKDNERKDTGDGYIKSWLEEPRSIDEDGKVTTNLHTIYDIGLLKELEMYNPLKGNYDRMSAFRIQMYHGRELIYQNREVKRESKAFGRLKSRSCFK